MTADRKQIEKEDAEICAQTQCSCGHVGLRYQPIWGRNGQYSPISICPKCKERTEF
jgi:hypothetical protein